MSALILILTQRGRYHFTNKDKKTQRALNDLPKGTQPGCPGAGISIRVPGLPRFMHFIEGRGMTISYACVHSSYLGV